MTKKAATIAAALILLLIAVPVTYLQSRDSTDREGQTRSDSTAVVSPAAGETERPARRERESNADTELVARFGESRVKHSRRIALRMLMLNELVAKSAEDKGGITIQAAARIGGNQHPEAIREAVRREAERPKPILYSLETMEAARRALKEDPSPLQELLLAGDVVSRGEMEKTDYDSLFEQADESLLSVIVGRNGSASVLFGGGQMPPPEEIPRIAIRENPPASLDDLEKRIESRIKMMKITRRGHTIKLNTPLQIPLKPQK
ncbi:MAG: hypothetical protein ABJQ29_03930 [Luteolibacter sp.]